MAKKHPTHPVFTTAREGADDDPDSDEEGAREHQQEAQQQRSTRGNITGAELASEGDVIITEAKSKKRITLSLHNRDSVVCAVCGQTGHTAGFIGAVYVDCPIKPCYLCKKSGHTAATCPFRIDPTLNVAPAAGTTSKNIAQTLQSRELNSSTLTQARPRNIPRRPHDWKIRSACLKLHSRRVTALDFPPGSVNLVCSADKKGRIAVWDFEEVTERTVFENVHEYQINAMRFLPGGDGMALLTASCDGLVCAADIETGVHHSLCNLNPGGWVTGVSNERNWKMMQSLAVHAASPTIAWAGDNQGLVRCLDLRAKDVAWKCRAHAAGNKVTSLDCHPMDANLLLSAGNDHFAKLFDIRALRDADVSAKGPRPHLAVMEHPRVISAASFSPRTGSAIMTTCGDNRIRVWDDVTRADEAPSRELVHSHDFNRYLSPFKAQWDPKDATERTVVIGRYISEDHSGVVLHPIDILDVGTGALVDALVDPNLQLINPVNMPHPLIDVIVTGSSGHLYCWRPEEADSDADDIVRRAPGETAGASTSDASAPSSGAAMRGSRLFNVFDVSGEEKAAKKKQQKSAGSGTKTEGVKGTVSGKKGAAEGKNSAKADTKAAHTRDKQDAPQKAKESGKKAGKKAGKKRDKDDGEGLEDKAKRKEREQDASGGGGTDAAAASDTDTTPQGPEATGSDKAGKRHRKR